MRPVLEAGIGRTHGWSVGTGEVNYSFKLSDLEEGQSRLASCTPLPESVRKASINTCQERQKSSVHTTSCLSAVLFSLSQDIAVDKHAVQPDVCLRTLSGHPVLNYKYTTCLKAP